MKPLGPAAAMAEEQLSPGTSDTAGSELAEPAAEPEPEPDSSSGLDAAADAKRGTGIGVDGKSSHGIRMKALYASSLISPWAMIIGLGVARDIYALKYG